MKRGRILIMKGFSLACRLAFKVVLKEKATLILINLSILVLTFTLLVTYGIINSLQQVHLNAINNVHSFDFVIEGKDNQDKLLNSLPPSVKSYHFFSDLEVFCAEKNDKYTLRFADDGYYNRPEFENEFVFFTPPSRNEVAVSTLANLPGVNTFYYLKKNTSDRAILSSAVLNLDLLFYSKSPVLNNYCFTSTSHTLCPKEELKLGVYAKSKAGFQKFLKSSKIPYKDSSVFDNSLITALKIERLLFVFALVFIILIMLILLVRQSIRIVEKGGADMNVLNTLGLTNSKINALFTIPNLIPSFLAVIIGSLSALIISANDKFRQSLFRVIIGRAEGIKINIPHNFFITYIVISLAVLIIVDVLLTNRAKIKLGEYNR